MLYLLKLPAPPRAALCYMLVVVMISYDKAKETQKHKTSKPNIQAFLKAGGLDAFC